MKLMLKTKLPADPNYLTYSSKILSIGSCFSDEVATKMKNEQFEIEANPCGVIFNPESILNVLEDAFSFTINEKHIIDRDGLWLNYDYHSSIFGTSRQELLTSISDCQEILNDQLKTSSHIFVTFGSAWVYSLNETKRKVANCHKMPNGIFEKKLIELEQLYTGWQSFIDRLNKLNPAVKILFTVSPIRHSKDGLRENNLSKGILHQLVYQLENNNAQVSYFPSYEIIIDELRDYRFYKNDMVHPSGLAVDYVYDKFKSAYFSDKTKELSILCGKLQKAKGHQFINASSLQIQQHESLIQNLEEQISILRK